MDRSKPRRAKVKWWETEDGQLGLKHVVKYWESVWMAQRDPFSLYEKLKRCSRWARSLTEQRSSLSNWSKPQLHGGAGEVAVDIPERRDPVFDHRFNWWKNGRGGAINFSVEPVVAFSPKLIDWSLPSQSYQKPQVAIPIQIYQSFKSIIPRVWRQEKIEISSKCAPN